MGDWRQSGLSAKRYAAEHGMTASSLWSWSREFEEPKTRRAFDEVRVVADVPQQSSAPLRVGTTGRIEVTMPSGSIVRVYGDVDAGALTAVMQVLARC